MIFHRDVSVNSKKIFWLLQYLHRNKTTKVFFSVFLQLFMERIMDMSNNLEEYSKMASQFKKVLNDDETSQLDAVACKLSSGLFVPYNSKEFSKKRETNEVIDEFLSGKKDVFFKVHTQKLNDFLMVALGIWISFVGYSYYYYVNQKSMLWNIFLRN
jgi:hypothetical protein